MIELLRDVLEFEFEELDLDEDTPKEWAMGKFNISEEEYNEIFQKDKKLNFSYLVEERGRERHEGDFHTIYCACDDLDTARKRYEEYKQRLFEEKDFFLKDELEKGNYTEHDLISDDCKIKAAGDNTSFNFSFTTKQAYLDHYDCNFIVKVCDNNGNVLYQSIVVATHPND